MSRTKRTTPLQMVLIVAMFLGVAALPILFEIDNVRLAFGLTGTPGYATVTGCVELDYEGDSVDCDGVFVPDDAPQDVRHVDMPSDSDAGDEFAARLSPEGDRAYPTTWQGRLMSLALPMLGVAILVPIPWAVVAWLRRKPLGVGSFYVIAALCGLCLLITFAGLAVSAF
ncbi:hypothetical protein [Thermomonospora cellulosilytica]|uniref:Uncharacterized protein n=1 Tax=Thermomonospora cellulosilytica TaxID=1411118 RepID=A0A7W3MSP4_9ACTN|nr:hypothetical protein [Thermomonospora cellulosilytica]MBA9001191.1 hypothetical protein [Thermomonospora cellulosilytica]